ncbi:MULTISPECIES: sel1 repeat family protein [Pantoea]|uniref:sel1 repeat family protein n=1 Tax=Pantoea TaxID=53335 RepID=UPI0012E07A68|nr:MULTISPECIES: sel1 repeat family protein [Pantoea]
MMKKSLYCSLLLLEVFLISSPACAQSDKEIYEAYDSCQVDVQACQQAAEHGDAQAQYNLGKMYYTGEGLPRTFRRQRHYGKNRLKKVMLSL